MSLEHGILGFLDMTPLSGYDIKKLFDMSASYFWPADQNQIYRTLKRLTEEGFLELMECRKGETVARKVYIITEKGRKSLRRYIKENSIGDFISRDAYLLQMFFSGALSRQEQLQFIDMQLEHNNELIQELTDNYNLNHARFTNMTGLIEGDRRLESAVWAHRWGLIECRAYSAFLEQIKSEILQNCK